MREELLGFLEPLYKESTRETGWWESLPAFGPFRRHSFPLRLRGEQCGTWGYLRVITEFLATLPWEELATRLLLPVLGITGERDQVCPPSALQSWCEKAPQARVQVIAGATHFNTLLAPETATGVANFIRHAR